MSDSFDYDAYLEAYKQEAEYGYNIEYKKGFTSGNLTMRSAFAIGYVFTKLEVSTSLIKDSLLLEKIEKYYIDVDDMIKDIKKYSYLIAKELKDGNYDEAEKLNTIFGIVDTNNENFDLSYAKKMIGEIISSLSFLLANQGISKDDIIKTLLEAKLFANLFSEDEIKKLYKQGMYNFLNQIIAEMHHGNRKNYAKHMNRQEWLVDRLIDNGTFSKETLKSELNKIIDYSRDCTTGFKNLGYPYDKIYSILPYGFYLKELEDKDKK